MSAESFSCMGKRAYAPCAAHTTHCHTFLLADRTSMSAAGHTSSAAHSSADHTSSVVDGGREEPPPNKRWWESAGVKPLRALGSGCVLRNLQVAVTSCWCSERSMGPVGKGSWPEWEYAHDVVFLDTIWRIVSKQAVLPEHQSLFLVQF